MPAKVDILIINTEKACEFWLLSLSSPVDSVAVTQWLDFIGRTGVCTRHAPGVDQSRDRFTLYAVYLQFSFFEPVYKMIEYQIIIRQLAMKSWRSLSWVTYIRHILSRYDLPDIYIMLQSQSSRSRWKMTCETAVHSYWESRLNQQILLYPSLKLMYRDTYRIGKLHTTISTVRPSIMDGRRSPTKLRLLTGTYGLQTNRPAFNQHYSTTCLLCKTVPETREHFICQCPALQNIRSTAWQDLHSTLNSPRD